MGWRKFSAPQTSKFFPHIFAVLIFPQTTAVLLIFVQTIAVFSNNGCFSQTNSCFYIFLDNDRFCTSLRTMAVFIPLQVTVESDLSSDGGCLFFITRQQLFSYASAHKKTVDVFCMKKEEYAISCQKRISSNFPLGKHYCHT